VKMSQTSPERMVISEGEKCVSFDGDADRIVYFFQDGEESSSSVGKSDKEDIQ